MDKHRIREIAKILITGEFLLLMKFIYHMKVWHQKSTVSKTSKQKPERNRLLLKGVWQCDFIHLIYEKTNA